MGSQISKPHLILTGILGWGIYCIMENTISVFCVGKYFGYYLLSSCLWLLFGLLASLLIYWLAMLIGHIVRLEQVIPIQILAFFALAPACFYCLIQLNKSLPGTYHSLLNIFLDGFALVIFLLVAIFLYRTWKNRKISLFDSVAYNLLFGGFGISGTLLLTCEPQLENWPLNVALVFVFCAIMPSVLVILFNRTTLLKKFIYILVILGFSIVLEERYLCSFVHNQVFTQARSNKIEITRAQENATNIILIVADTLRAKNMSLYGYQRNTTPNLDIFAQDSITFLDAISSAPWTLPSHASLFTGYFSNIHGADHVTDEAVPALPLSAGFDALAELLVSAGYKTAAIVANQACLGPWTGLNQGFDFYWWGRSRDGGLLTSILSGHLPKKARDRVFRFCGFDFHTSARRINQLALHWLKSKKNYPFFMFINYMETHGSAYLPPGFARLFTSPPAPSFPEKDVNTGYPIVTHEQIDRIRSWYDNETASVDNEIGRFISVLKKIDRYERTLIIITSDHGELLGEHDDFDHGFCLYNELLHVPLIVKYPLSQHRNSINEKPIQNVDVFAEILNAAKIKIPEGVQGQPFNEANHPVISEVRRIPRLSNRWPARYDQDLEAIIPIEYPQFKLIRSTKGLVEIFSRRDDPEEMYDIKDQSKKQEILQQLNNYLMKLNPIRQKYEALKVSPKKIDDMTKERLRALGYVK